MSRDVNAGAMIIYFILLYACKSDQFYSADEKLSFRVHRVYVGRFNYSYWKNIINIFGRYLT